MFFFEKKNQKTFPRFPGKVRRLPHQADKVFLLLFLQKKKALA
jgi:hypothetical protein